MQRKPPDTRIYSEITELNREFLHLLAHIDRAGQQPVFGLDPLLAKRLASLDPMEREAIASTPCLLAEFRSLPGPNSAPAITDGAHRDSGWSAACRRDIEVFAASLLTYLWQSTHGHPLLTTLCIGLNRDAYRMLSELSFSRIRQHAEHAATVLQARLCAHPRFWPDLLGSVSIPDRNLRVLSRLSIVQLTVAQSWPRDTGRTAPYRRS
jgi:hypothetical protein